MNIRRIPGTIVTAVLLTSATTMACADGETIYQESCAACHDAGVAEAPRLGDTKAWAPLIAKGRNQLIAYALNGPGHLTWDNETIRLGVMPAKGGTKDMSAEDVTAAVDYIIARSR